jgi:hypothetical protein
MRRFAIALAALVFTALYFSPDASAFGRRNRGNNECCCENCSCGENCDCGHERRHRARGNRHETCCNHCEQTHWCGCMGNYGCGGGCVGYVPVVVYRPVAYYSGCLGCTGMYAGGCVGRMGMGYAGAPTHNNSGGHWEWKPNQKQMPKQHDAGEEKDEGKDRKEMPKNKDGNDGI